MRILLVRHGESEWNADRRLQGQADIALSPAGIRQAQALAPTIAAIAPDAAVSSDLQRAVHTAALLSYPQADLLPALREIDVGQWSGCAIDTLRAEQAEQYQGWRAGSYTPPGGETWAEFSARTAAGIEALRGQWQGKNVLAVCHGGVIRALLQHYLDLPPQRIIPVASASLTALRLSAQGGTRLELFNYRPQALQVDAPD